MHELEILALGQDQFAWRKNHEYVVLMPGFVLVRKGLDIELESVLGERLRTMHAWLLCQQVRSASRVAAQGVLRLPEYIQDESYYHNSF